MNTNAVSNAKSPAGLIAWRENHAYVVIIVIALTFLIALGMGLFYCSRRHSRLENIVKIGTNQYKIICGDTRTPR